MPFVFLWNMRIIQILENTTDWNQVFVRLLTIDSSGRLAGILFEKFAKLYFLHEPSVSSDYKNVWLFDEIPSFIKDKLKIGSIDRGIDLVLEDNEGKLIVVQCKFRLDQTKNLSWTKDKLVNLFAEGDRADSFLVFTNASGVDEYSRNKKKSFSMITLGDLLNLKEEILKKMSQTQVSEKIFFSPRTYQQEAIDTVVKGFKNNNRGQLILPCGAGKTFTSLWIKEEMNPQKTLVLLPSLALLKQIKVEWHSQQKEWMPYLCICSEKDIDSKKDALLVHPYEIGRNVSTDVEEIKNFLLSHDKYTLYSTYQSLPVLGEALKILNEKIDLVICDEAHKTSGLKNALFGYIHHNENIAVKKRLYMTATPRIVSKTIKKNLKENLDIIADMSDIAVYGKEFYRMSFGEAIERKILVDYQIIAIGVSDVEVQNLIQQGSYSKEGTTAEDIANNFALEKVMKKYNTKHAITFHSTIKRASDFKDRQKEISDIAFVETVTGKQTTNQRSIYVDAFKNADSGILTNARCLTEGIDIPAIDVVYFCDPKNSKVDIVQASGRALRKSSHKDKEKGYIVVPIYHSQESNLENAIEESSFQNLISIVRALCDQDERLQIEINTLQLQKKKGGLVGVSRLSLDMEEESLLLFTEIEQQLKESLFDQVIEKTSNPWDIFFEELVEYLENHDGEYPNTAKSDELSQWIGAQRVQYKKNKLSFFRFQKLEKINFIWDKQEYEFLRKLEKLKNFLETNGVYPVQRSHDKNESRLAIFSQDNRTRRRKGRLKKRYIEWLDEMGFVWEPYSNKFEEGLLRVAEFIEMHDRPPMSFSEGKKEAKLFSWIVSQQKKELTRQEKEKFEMFGLSLNDIENQRKSIIQDGKREAWLENFEKVREIKEKCGRWPTSRGGDGEKQLAGWLCAQRKNFKNNALDSFQIRSLDILGVWIARTDIKSNDERFFDQIEGLKKFVKKHDRWPTKMIKNTEERRLAMFCNNYRNRYFGRSKKYGALPQERIEAFERMGFDWGEEKKQSFEERFQELQYWMSENFRVPRSRGGLAKERNEKEQKERSLYNWIAIQRKNFRENKISEKEIQQFKSLGIELDTSS